MKIKIAVIVMISAFTSVEAQWNSNGNNSSTGNLTLEGSSININTPITTGGWARGINNMATDKSTRIGGIGLLGSGASTVKYYYMAHGESPYSSGLGLYIKPNGNTGIGTVNPQAKLHIYDGNTNGVRDLYADLVVEGMDSRLQLLSTNTGSNGSSISLTNENTSWTLHQKTLSIGNRFDIGYRVSDDIEDIAALQKIYFSILNNDNVGIGTTTTGSHKLAVEGSIGAREIKVEGSGWSDFVFEKDYELPSLENVEKHIKEKGHLQDIPSAKEVEKNGFYLGEMDAKLLQKIEELTLYTIQQEKEIKELKKQNSKVNKQQKELEELKTLVKNLLKTKN